jgi:hypothetical protein
MRPHHLCRYLAAAVAVISPLMPTVALAGQTGPGTVYDLQIDGNRVLFGVTGTSTGKPACAVWSRYVFDITAANGPALLSYILTAQATGKVFRVYGTNTCSIIADTETAYSLRDG